MYPKKILYADDDQESRENYVYVLSKLFESVYSACDGEEALNIYKKFSPDIVLLDITMPKIDGLEVARIIRESDYKTHILMLTAHSDQARLFQAVNLQLDGYLVKPIDDELLIATIKKLMDKISNKENTLFINKDLIWDRVKKTLHYKKSLIELTKKETLLFELLSQKMGAYVNRYEIISSVWEDEFPDETHEQKLTQLAYRLNKKLSNIIKLHEPIIQSSYAFGYRVSI